MAKSLQEIGAHWGLSEYRLMCSTEEREVR